MGVASLAGKASATPKTEQKFLLPVNKLPGKGRFQAALGGLTQDEAMGQPVFTLTMIPVKNVETGAECRGSEHPPLKIVLDFSMDDGMKNVDEGSGQGKHNIWYIGGAQPEDASPDYKPAALAVLEQYLGTVDKDGKWIPGHLGWNGEVEQRFHADGYAIITVEIAKPNEIRAQPGRFYLPAHKIVDMDRMPTKEEEEMARNARRAATMKLLRREPATTESTTDTTTTDTKEKEGEPATTATT